MKFNLLAPTLEYKLDGVEWYDSKHGFPAVSLHISAVDHEPSKMVGSFTMAVHDVVRIMQDMPLPIDVQQLTAWSGGDELTGKVVAAIPSHRGPTMVSVMVLTEVVKRMRASGLNDDTIESFLLEPPSGVVLG